METAAARTSKKSTVYGVVTDQFIKRLREGVIPWGNRFRVDGCPHMNLCTKAPYRGVNTFVTTIDDHDSPFWVSRRQAAILGMEIREGEDYAPIVYFTMLQDKEDPTIRRPLVRYSQCFNVGQMAKVPDGVIPPIPPRISPVVGAEELIEAIRPRLPPAEPGAKTRYSDADDRLYVMDQALYRNRDEFYTDFLKHCAISAAHSSRLGLRRMGVAELELFGELGSAFLCGECGIKFSIEDSARYVAKWIDRLRDDASLVINASKNAHRAVEYLTGRKSEEAAADYRKLFLENALNRI